MCTRNINSEVIIYKGRAKTILSHREWGRSFYLFVMYIYKPTIPKRNLHLRSNSTHLAQGNGNPSGKLQPALTVVVCINLARQPLTERPRPRQRSKSSAVVGREIQTLPKGSKLAWNRFPLGSWSPPSFCPITFQFQSDQFWLFTPCRPPNRLAICAVYLHFFDSHFAPGPLRTGLC